MSGGLSDLFSPDSGTRTGCQSLGSFLSFHDREGLKYSLTSTLSPFLRIKYLSLTGYDCWTLNQTVEQKTLKKSTEDDKKIKSKK